MYYGFCPRNNPHDRLTLSIDPNDVPDGTGREVLMRLNGIPTEHMLRPMIEVTDLGGSGEGWSSLGILPPQLLRCLRLLVSEDPADVDPSATPGSQDASRELDLQCADVMEDLLKSVIRPFVNCADKQALWWPLFGDAVGSFHQSQFELLKANLAAVDEFRVRLGGSRTNASQNLDMRVDPPVAAISKSALCRIRKFLKRPAVSKGGVF